MFSDGGYSSRIETFRGDCIVSVDKLFSPAGKISRNSTYSPGQQSI